MTWSSSSSSIFNLHLNKRRGPSLRSHTHTHTHPSPPLFSNKRNGAFVNKRHRGRKACEENKRKNAAKASFQKQQESLLDIFAKRAKPVPPTVSAPQWETAVYARLKSDGSCGVCGEPWFRSEPLRSTNTFCARLESGGAGEGLAKAVYARLKSGGSGGVRVC